MESSTHVILAVRIRQIVDKPELPGKNKIWYLKVSFLQCGGLSTICLLPCGAVQGDTLSKNCGDRWIRIKEHFNVLKFKDTSQNLRKFQDFKVLWQPWKCYLPELIAMARYKYQENKIWYLKVSFLQSGGCLLFA